MNGRPWFLGQTPPPVEASDAELDAEGMAKLTAWLADPAVDADLEDTAPASRGAVYRTTEGAAMPSLDDLLAAARNHVMSPEERDAQRQSWVRGELAMGNDRDEAEYRRKTLRPGVIRERAAAIDYETPGD